MQVCRTYRLGSILLQQACLEETDVEWILGCADVAPVRKAGVSAAVSIMRGCNNM